MNKNITFTPIYEIEKEYYPVPASQCIPDWYKRTQPYFDSNKLKINDDGIENKTIKKCIPVFDALTSGYIIKTPCDVHVSISEYGHSYYRWPTEPVISFHPVQQAQEYPQKVSNAYPKWNNPWSIKTTSGYSCLFISPMHNPNGIFTILPGIVDTDSYINPVNFPFTLNDENFEGVIPAGTNIAQVIPFKRDSFTMSIGNNVEEISNSRKFLSRHFKNRYKNKFWSRKEYK